MTTLFVIGLIVLSGKHVHFDWNAVWGTIRGVHFMIGIPALLIVLFAARLTAFAVPFMILALLAALLWPVMKGMKSMNAVEKTAWIDEDNKIVSFQAIENGKRIMKTENLFWDYIMKLMQSGYRIM